MIQNISLPSLEKELKKRWSIPYQWGKKQNNADDKLTNCIYTTPFFHQVERYIKQLDSSLYHYAWNRWYNFWSSQAVESVFATVQEIVPNPDTKNRTVDFFWNDIPFDHKTTVFPKGFGKDFQYAKSHPEDLVLWLYENQSQEQRHHLHNRFFLVLHDSLFSQHWKMKAELLLLHRSVSEYMKDFSLEQCVSFSRGGNTGYAGVIWIDQ